MTNAETNTTDAQTGALVLKDQAGDYYVLPQDLVQRGKVPTDRRVEVERLLAKEDVQGYLVNGIIAGMITGFVFYPGKQSLKEWVAEHT